MKRYIWEYIGAVCLFVFILLLAGMFGYEMGYEACMKDAKIFLYID